MKRNVNRKGEDRSLADLLLAGKEGDEPFAASTNLTYAALNLILKTIKYHRLLLNERYEFSTHPLPESTASKFAFVRKLYLLLCKPAFLHLATRFPLQLIFQPTHILQLLRLTLIILVTHLLIPRRLLISLFDKPRSRK